MTNFGFSLGTRHRHFGQSLSSSPRRPEVANNHLALDVVSNRNKGYGPFEGRDDAVTLFTVPPVGAIGAPLPKSWAIRTEKHLELDQRTGVLDVHVLDVLAQVEALLRGAREIQRQILRVRGVPRRRSLAQRRSAATVVRQTAREMLEDSRALAGVLRELQRDAETLQESADGP